MATTTIDLSSLNGTNGFRIKGEATGDWLGYAVSNAGDVNNDGFDDLIVSAIQADPNGENPGAGYVLFGRSDFSSDNVIEGTPKNDVLKSTPGADIFEALGGNDTLLGYGGADILKGGAGADTMKGGTGNDTYFVDNIGDKVVEKVSQGKDQISSSITHTLSANVENLTLTGTAKINATGNGLANVIIGNSAANQLNGRAGNDILDGRGGFDKLTGGTGNDIFKFTTKGNIDKITDYNVAKDTIQLENAVFTKLTTGTLAASQFKVGAQAADANDFIIYNKPTGALLYDADGSGATAATQIATVSAGLTLTNADIFVI